MIITFDLTKRNVTLAERGLDFADAREVFAGRTFDAVDDRFPYPETRVITVGKLRGRIVVVVWTAVPGGRRIISMRKANSREQARYDEHLD